VTYTYDNNGNLISESDGATTYEWDYENRLVTINNPQYTINNVYDAFGKRVAVTRLRQGYGGQAETTKYLYDGMLPIIEKDISDSTLATYTRGLSYGGGIGGIISANRGGNNYYYHYNGIGSVTALTDSASAVVATYDYDAYGNTLASTGTVPNPYGFSTKEFSSATGLAYFGFRYYNPNTGRWLSQDPLGMVDGPNLYAYVKNNSVNWIDLYGLFHFGKRPLTNWPWIYGMSNNPVYNYFNIELSHEHGFFEDGSGYNRGFGPNGRFSDDNLTGYRYDNTHYDDALMRKALKNLNDGKYHWLGNNCQDWCDRLRDEYEKLKEEQENGKYADCNDGAPTNPDAP
jgi:RHS repeat-associated protein